MLTTGLGGPWGAVWRLSTQRGLCSPGCAGTPQPVHCLACRGASLAPALQTWQEAGDEDRMWQVSRKPAVGKVAAGLWQWQLGVGHDPVSSLEESLSGTVEEGAGILNYWGTGKQKAFPEGRATPGPRESSQIPF